MLLELFFFYWGFAIHFLLCSSVYFMLSNICLCTVLFLVTYLHFEFFTFHSFIYLVIFLYLCSKVSLFLLLVLLKSAHLLLRRVTEWVVFTCLSKILLHRRVLQKTVLSLLWLTSCFSVWPSFWIRESVIENVTVLIRLLFYKSESSRFMSKLTFWKCNQGPWDGSEVGKWHSESFILEQALSSSVHLGKGQIIFHYFPFLKTVWFSDFSQLSSCSNPFPLLAAFWYLLQKPSLEIPIPSLVWGLCVPETLCGTAVLERQNIVPFCFQM